MPVAQTIDQLDQETADYLRNLRAQAGSLAGQPFTPFQGQRFAPIPAEEAQARKQATAQVGRYEDLLRNARVLQQQASTPYTQTWQQYQSPYQQAVVDRVGKLGARNLEENILPALDARFAHSGLFGSRSHQQASQRAARDIQAEISDIQGQLLHQGYESAAKHHDLDRERELEASKMAAALGQAEQTQGWQDIQNLLKMADVVRAEDQQHRDYEYEKYLMQQHHPYEQLNLRTSMLRGMPYGMTSYRHAEGRPTSMRANDYRGLGLSAIGSMLNPSAGQSQLSAGMGALPNYFGSR